MSTTKLLGTMEEEIGKINMNWYSLKELLFMLNGDEEEVIDKLEVDGTKRADYPDN